MSPTYQYHSVDNEFIPSSANRLSKIVGGFSAEPNEFPYQVNLRYHDRFVCGGSIINTLIILTAAHCVKYKIPGKLSVVAGDHDRIRLEGKEQFRNVSNIIRHEEYDWDTDVNDIAILTLTTPLEFNEYVSSIALPKAYADFSGMGMVTGWGKVGDRETSPSSDVLQKLRVPIVPRRECENNYKNVKGMNITLDMMCAGDVGKDSCQADSGGPLTCTVPETGDIFQCGIVSHGIGCGRKGYPGIYCNVSHFTQWIDITIKQFTLKGKCKINRFYCPEDNKCIPRSQICNAIKDCSNGSDEQNCQQLVQSPPNYFRCSNGISIRLAWLCDGMDDCGDSSDEDKCSKAPCSETQFQCKSPDSRCIEKGWVCDNELIDCEDASDEANCDNELVQVVINTTTTPIPFINTTSSTEENCAKGFFRCASNRIRGVCIPQRWKCDGERDCRLGDDEENCGFSINSTTTSTTSPPTTTLTPACTSTQFWCNQSQLCVPKSLLCDQDEDCEFGEDESNCFNVSSINGNPNRLNATKITTLTMRPTFCSINEFQCKSGECILKVFLCDLDWDCKNGEDESSCEIKQECSSYQWRCANGDCIYHKFRCDNEADCIDSSDEVGCAQEEEMFKGKNCTDTQFRCRRGNCIPKSFQCDTDFDCEPNGEDEEGCPEFRSNIFLNESE